LQTICPSWPQFTILLITASQVARIIGVGHLHLDREAVFKSNFNCFV
jgi:hypothetical protein